MSDQTFLLTLNALLQKGQTLSLKNQSWLSLTNCNLFCCIFTFQIQGFGDGGLLVITFGEQQRGYQGWWPFAGHYKGHFTLHHYTTAQSRNRGWHETQQFVWLTTGSCSINNKQSESILLMGKKTFLWIGSCYMNCKPTKVGFRQIKT